MGEAVLEGERIDERLQRRARRAQRAASCRWRRPARARRKPALPTWARTSPGLVVERPGWRRRAAAPTPPRARAPASPGSPAAGRRSRGDGLSGPASAATAASAAWAASIGKGRRAAGTGSALAASASAAVRTPRATARSSTRSRARRAASAKRSGRRSSGRLRQGDEQRGLGEGEALRLLAEIGQGRGPRAFQIAAVGREREVERRGSRPSTAAARAARRARSGAAWRASVRSSRGSRRRATCMVSVEPPETTRPCRTSCAPARRSASGSTPGWRSKRASS